MTYGEGATTVDRFYDRTLRTHVLTFRDADGNQVGDAEYIGNGREAADKVESQMLDAILANNLRSTYGLDEAMAQELAARGLSVAEVGTKYGLRALPQKETN